MIRKQLKSRPENDRIPVPKKRDCKRLDVTARSVCKKTLLDEPFAALGVEQTAKGLEMIRKVAERGVGVIVITHIMAQAFQVADRIVVIRQGKVAGDIETEKTTPDQAVELITGGTLSIAGMGRGHASTDPVQQGKGN